VGVGAVGIVGLRVHNSALHYRGNLLQQEFGLEGAVSLLSRIGVGGRGETISLGGLLGGLGRLLIRGGVGGSRT